MIETRKRSVYLLPVLALLLAIGAPVQADGDKVKDDHGLVKVVHVFKRAKPGGAGGAPKPATGYKLAPWKWNVSELHYTVYTSTLAGTGLLETETIASLQEGFIAWSVANPKAPTSVQHVTSSAALPDLETMSGANEILWKPLDDPGTIAVTTTWYYTRGANKGLAAEFDMAFNTNFAWSNSGEADKMDVWNITTHEAGHALGLDHSSSSTELTMYPYAAEGEIKKRDLASGDVAGILARYP